jgi:hypothetical protein
MTSAFGAIGTACGGAEVNHLHFQRIPGQPPCSQELAAETAKLGALKGELEDLYNRLLTAAPQAKLVVVGYPRVFPASYTGLPIYQGKSFCILDHYPVGPLTLDVGLPVTDAQAIDRFEVKLNSTIQRATMMTRYPPDAARIKYADTYDASVPRNCKGTTPHASVAGLVLSPGLHGVGSWFKSLIGSGTFHPTADGQKMMAGIVQAAFNSFPAPTAPAPTTPTFATKASWTNSGMSFNVANYAGNLQPAAVSCAAATQCIAIGSEFDSADNGFTAVADDWRGSSWQEISFEYPSGIDLFSVSCPTAEFCMAVGRTAFQGDESSPVAERWQNGVWTAEQPPPSPGGGYANLFGVSCPSESGCIAVGVQQDGPSTTPFAEQWSSGSWTVTPMPEEGLQLDAVSCVSATWCWAVVGANQGNTNARLLSSGTGRSGSLRVSRGRKYRLATRTRGRSICVPSHAQASRRASLSALRERLTSGMVKDGHLTPPKEALPSTSWPSHVRRLAAASPPETARAARSCRASLDRAGMKNPKCSATTQSSRASRFSRDSKNRLPLGTRQPRRLFTRLQSGARDE